MNTPQENERVHVCEDPRHQADFKPQHYPRVSGRNAPEPDATERNERIVLEFLAAYYELNCAQERLLELKSQPESEQRRKGETQCLQSVERLLVRRDQLEDSYAPFGVIAEPVVENGFTKELVIAFGNLDEDRRRPQWHPFTAYVPIALPDGIDLENLPMQIERPNGNAP